MKVAVFQICFIFGRANFTAGDRVYWDDIKPLMYIVEIMIDG